MSALSRVLARYPVATVALSQFFGTSVWFSANSAADDLSRAWGLQPADLGWLVNCTQAGFIVGTSVFALTGLADRFAASRIFACCAVLAAVLNGSFALLSGGLASASVYRFLVGLCLAGIYPVGMKLIVSWAPERAGAALSLLVGMLTLGTALPHGVRAMGHMLDWRVVILASSGLALCSAVVMAQLGDGPHLKSRPAGGAGGLGAVWHVWREPTFRASALGYFGHMWELYACWTLLPMLLAQSVLAQAPGGVSAMAFAIMAVGALGCVLGGWLGRRIGSARVALGALMGSGACAVVSSVWGRSLPAPWLMALLLCWGLTVIADSPHFSALSSRASPPHLVGSALALQNAVGFGLTLVAIGLTTRHVGQMGWSVVWWLVPGPVMGVWALWPLAKSAPPA